MQILLASLVKNEANRFLPSAIDAWGEFADKLLVIDDHSTDESVLIAKSKGAEVISSTLTESLWGAETPLRQQLWEESLKRTESGDFIFILDADMVPAKNPRDLIQPHTDAIAFPLYDLWAEYSDGMLMYRDDRFWQGHNNHRVWMIKRPEDTEWKWSGRGIHSGHFPVNLTMTNPIFTPEDYGLLHYAYKNNNLRTEKLKKYLKVANQLSNAEKMHANSIMDQSPKLKCLEFTPEFRLKCAS